MWLWIRFYRQRNQEFRAFPACWFHSNYQCFRSHTVVFTHFEVGGIHSQEGIIAFNGTAAESGDLLIKIFAYSRNRGFGHVGSAKRLNHSCDFTG